MSKPVTGQTTFGASTTGTTTQLDNNFLLAYNALNDLNTYSNYLVDGGAANAYSVTLGASLTGALTAGLKIQMKVSNTNTGPSTLNYNATGILAIQTTRGGALGAGMLVSGGIYDLIYTGSVWQVQNPTATSGWVLLGTASANANATIDFNASITPEYDEYSLKISGAVVAQSGSVVVLRVGNGNASNGNYQAGTYTWSGFATQGGSSLSAISGSTNNSNATAIFLSSPAGLFSGIANTANTTYGADVSITKTSGNATPTVRVMSDYLSGADALSYNGGGIWKNNSNITSVQVLTSNGNFTSGNFALYGLVRV